ncbi:hypothetical protein LguiA_005120 [Lonicera macranthoides]
MPMSPIWKAAGLCTHILGHSGAITSVRMINPRAVESGTDLLVATGSKDRTLRLWMLDADESMDHPTKVTAFRTLRGHSASVQSIAPQASGDMVCSGSWDSRINVWHTKESDTRADFVSVKMRRKDSEDVDSQSEGEAVSTLVGHMQCISSVWPVTVIESHKDKVLCADWWKGDSVVSGGVDLKLSISSEVLYSHDLLLAHSTVPLEPFRTLAHSKVGRCRTIQGLGPQGYAEGDDLSQTPTFEKGSLRATEPSLE